MFLQVHSLRFSNIKEKGFCAFCLKVYAFTHKAETPCPLSLRYRTWIRNYFMVIRYGKMQLFYLILMELLCSQTRKTHGVLQVGLHTMVSLVLSTTKWMAHCVSFYEIAIIWRGQFSYYTPCSHTVIYWHYMMETLITREKIAWHCRFVSQQQIKTSLV